MEPSSPIRYDTSEGSIHTVNSFGRLSTIQKESQFLAVVSIRESLPFPLIRKHLNALPFIGRSGYQWPVYIWFTSLNNLSLKTCKAWVLVCFRWEFCMKSIIKLIPASISCSMLFGSYEFISFSLLWDGSKALRCLLFEGGFWRFLFFISCVVGMIFFRAIWIFGVIFLHEILTIQKQLLSTFLLSPEQHWVFTIFFSFFFFI